MISNYLLLIILFAPFLGATVLFFIPNTQKDVVRSITVFFSGVSLLASLFLFYSFDISQGGYQFISRTVWSETLGISFYLGVDGIGAPMVLASALLMFCGVFVSWDVKDRLKEFYINLLILGSATMGVYMSLDLFFLFFFYELSVIPMYLFIIMWG
ncbi:MAG: NADH-quinone oxidoreductase subunit M, partial [Nitrospirota bacterium]|nr:NADH-quinone oxidoreductase subunit M [Nitrospirota bacterium]